MNGKVSFAERIVSAIATAAVFALCLVAVSWAGETKYSTSASATSPAVTFAPGNGQRTVVGLAASCDKVLGQVKFFARSGSGKHRVTEASDAASTNVVISNTSYGITNSDTVVIVHASGAAPEYRTVGVATATNFSITAGLTAATTTDDFVYEVAQAGAVPVGDSATAAGSNTVLNITGPIFTTPGDSPLHVTLDSSTNTLLQVVVD